MRRVLTILLLGIVLLAAITALIVYSIRPKPVTPTTYPATTQPTTAPSTQPATTKPGPITWQQFLITLPGMAGATPTDGHYPIESAAHIRLPYPTYICPRGDLWITHPEGRDLMTAGVEQSAPSAVHISRQQAVFVHWAMSGHRLQPRPIVRDADGTFRIVGAGRAPVQLEPNDYHWPYAISLRDAIVVPTTTGISVITTDKNGAIVQATHAFPGADKEIPQIEITPRGFVAWIPTRLPDASSPVAHYLDGQFIDLPAADWSGPLLHLIPFTDGSVLQIAPLADSKVKMRTVALESAPADAATVRQLVEQLSDYDPAIRDQAHTNLARIGPSAWKILSALRPTASTAEAQLRIDDILSAANRPTLGRFELADNELLAVWRLTDGVVFLSPSGVRAGSERAVVKPSWISVRRGKPIVILPPALAMHVAVGAVTLQACGDEWFLTDSSVGTKWFFGQELLPLAEGDDRRYSQVAGIDRTGRILLAPKSPSAADFLLIDPGIADPKPLLQLWKMDVTGGEVGWDSQGWPAVRRGGAYSLRADGWESLQGHLQTSADAPITGPGATGTMRKADGASPRGTVWVGESDLTIVGENGASVTQQRPAGVPRVDRASVIGDRLYLVDPDGGISLLRIMADSNTPFRLDGRFPDVLADGPLIRRVWGDPAGRLCIAADGQLIVIFPDKQISPAMLDMIPADELKRVKADAKTPWE